MGIFPFLRLHVKVLLQVLSDRSLGGFVSIKQQLSAASCRDFQFAI